MLEKTHLNERAETERVLVFTLSGQTYAVPLLKVREVIALPEITPVPSTPSYFKGLMNLRGQVISVFDLRLKLKSPKADVTRETGVILLDFNQLSLGVIVDSIDCVLAVEPEELQAAPELETQVGKDFIRGVIRKEKRLTLLLDIERTLDVEDLKTVRENQTKRNAA